MLSHLADIPTSIWPLGSVRWTLSWIVLLSVAYTYFINKFTDNIVPENGSVLYDNPEQKKRYFAQLKRLKAAQRDLEERRRRIIQTRPFRLMDLPPELSFAILSQCADWPSTYLSLVRVSKRCQALAFRACLPFMPIHLINPNQIVSFELFIRGHPKLTPLVQNMWATPLREDQLGTAVAMVKKCTNLRSLATNAHIVQEAITLRGGTRLSHLQCKSLTLLSARPDAWASLLATRNGATFFRQLTHLRLIGDRVPDGLPLPSLTHLSYGTSGRDMSVAFRDNGTALGLAMLADTDAYPALHTVIFTKPRPIAGGLRISRPVAKTRLFCFELPPTHTELEIWCDTARHRGMWVLCADPPAHTLARGRSGSGKKAAS
ncbi:hypothetical protein D9619_007426 [Psilocybe cf. subviscida]|uniref:F-box domain-containing protein n=1 Tax=Psilocybe cf. subviscida TaxID=2480587 RepID=A0A8H5B2B8_9AGAR|nr:hypothetical protein D9619_007426 [Psilocybe cf. subviscida]